MVTCGATTGHQTALDLRHLFARQLSVLGSYMGSKSELIQKIADEHSDKLTRKDVKGVLETLAAVGYKELKKSRQPRRQELEQEQQREPDKQSKRKGAGKDRPSGR